MFCFRCHFTSTSGIFLDVQFSCRYIREGCTDLYMPCISIRPSFLSPVPSNSLNSFLFMLREPFFFFAPTHASFCFVFPFLNRCMLSKPQALVTRCGFSSNFCFLLLLLVSATVTLFLRHMFITFLHTFCTSSCSGSSSLCLRFIFFFLKVLGTSP
uniref:WGS project CAEQ00000000 data, annotated contig 1705 n=1 Tax=Trypanosoma congolense (strain IL3000) TaxID=1068625 RepID=F9W848_TRYCI|nr:unnamed protein product [Trypanosoma congolense IL3000]